MKLFKIFMGLMLMQLVFITVFILFITGLRFLDHDSFGKVMDEYNSYAQFDVDPSLVYGDDD